MTKIIFIMSMCSLLLVSGIAADADGSTAKEPNIRFGVVSDIHVTTFESAATFRRALRYYREHDVDAVMICGDLSDFGVLCNLENVAKSWYEVFPGDRGKNEKHVEKLFIYGNHDVEPAEYGIGHVKLARSLILCPGYRADEVRLQRLDQYGLGKAWEECFHETFQPIYHKKVCGYDFIGAHWDTQACVRGLEEWFATHGKELAPDRPFFYFQHPHPKDTVYSYGPFTHDNGTSTRVLSAYPNAVAFSGHSHMSVTDERSLWQGAFTSIGASTLVYRGSAEPAKLIENTYSVVDPTEPARQGLLVSVYDDFIIIDRWDFAHDEPVDESWRLPLPAKPKSLMDRKAQSLAPKFEKGSAVVVGFPGKQGADGFVRFPPAVAEMDARPHDYAITIEHRIDDEILSCHMFRAYGPTVVLPKKHDRDVSRVTIKVPSAYCPHYDIGQVRLSVVPNNSLGKSGMAITSGWIPVPKM